MNIVLQIADEFKPYLVNSYGSFDDVHYIFKFPNNYGASVIKCKGSYGYGRDLWEMALIFFDEEDDTEYEITYEHDFDDVIGELTDDQVNELLRKIIKY